MLILTRRVGEKLVIGTQQELFDKDGNKVELAVLGVKGNQVRIGVDAPKEVAVHREEIYERILKEKQQQAAR